MKIVNSFLFKQAISSPSYPSYTGLENTSPKGLGKMLLPDKKKKNKLKKKKSLQTGLEMSTIMDRENYGKDTDLFPESYI
jgi:hypothetical protein